MIDILCYFVGLFVVLLGGKVIIFVCDVRFIFLWFVLVSKFRSEFLRMDFISDLNLGNLREIMW